MLFRTPIKINSIENIKKGTLVYIEGIVSDEKDLSFGKTFIVNEIPVFCTCSKRYENKNISVLGVVEDYYELRVKAISIKAYSEKE